MPIKDCANKLGFTYTGCMFLFILGNTLKSVSISFSQTLLEVYQLLSEFCTKPHSVWCINHNESNENKIHSSVLFDLQQYPFQHGQPTVIQSLSGTQSNRAASVNICWKHLERKPVKLARVGTRVFL